MTDNNGLGDHLTFRTIDLTKHYISGETVIKALRGVTLEIPKGDMVVLLGPSGSGKSTFLNIIGGLDTPTSGEVYFRNDRLSQYTEKELTLFRRHNVGFVFQAYNLVPSLTALENVALVTDISTNPLPPMEALEAVNLGDRASHFPSQLSGGEQQRVAIARALAKRPEVLLCDEPTGALDSATGIVVLRALQDVNKKYGTTTVIITHNASIANMADRVIYFGDGQVVDVKRNDNPISPEEISW
ncbi:ABC transporter ATP-binding protein [Emcibacter nanhaiensis]|uniref:ABC transporter ATP-binding protein n=1 Tax=Emcibacter nanhaiensis TaxID=1505037 RepID=A0A501PGJ6_9PROT|nr:ABC transporter ATP-binding protein [Emcibacter nanhaiensis]TPD59074.1 ABC transporter ATP-binding protein [Emcibacter nanhaiensis]